METKTIYAKTLNPESFDYRVYDIEEDEGNEVFIDGGRNFCNIDSKGYLTKIKKMISEYSDYELQVYHNNSIMDFLNYYLPKKENGKRLSTQEASWLKKVLELETDEREAICQFLITITGKLYRHKGLRGCCQGDYVEAYFPSEVGITKYLEYVEAWYFGTGIEVMIHDEESEPDKAEDVTGYTFYTASWKTEDIIAEIKEQCGYKAEDDVEVKLWLYKDTRTIHIDQYELATE